MDDLLRKAREASKPAEISNLPEGPPDSDGNVQTEVPVPAQPEGLPFPLDMKMSQVVFGEVRSCTRCKGTRGKRFDELGYFPDPDRRGDDKPCIRCNGWGIIPNIGP